MFGRKINQELEKWFNQKTKKALIIKGLKHIGKTTTVLEFCRAHYENIVYINFQTNQAIKSIFDGNLNIDKLIMKLSADITDKKFIPYKTVIILDEIQDCSNARTAIKPFVEDGRYDIIATGSKMGLRGYNKKQVRSIPVGFENIIEMKSMDFEEFLWAIGVNKNITSYLQECFLDKETIMEPMNKQIMDYFRQYLCVGGMPEVVSTFIKTNNMQEVRTAQIKILNSFKDDFGLHLNENEELTKKSLEYKKIMEVYNSIPSQLTKKNKKFKYSLINKDAKSREYLNSMIWLEEYGLINRCYRISNLDIPLSGYKEQDIFKIYVADTGLFMAMLDEDIYNNILTNNLNIYKGAIYENVIADAFTKSGRKLYYYSKQSGLELDFITTYKSKLTVIEVKATNNKSKSLNEVLTNKDKYDVESNFKLIDGNIGSNNIINTIPLYMAYLIK